MKNEKRKELIRAYHESDRPMGVYRVFSPEGEHAVVGSSSDVVSALNRHRAQLDMGSHPDRTLQGEWDLLGADAFEFEILDTLKPVDEPDYDPTDDLQELENMWRERLSHE